MRYIHISALLPAQFPRSLSTRPNVVTITIPPSILRQALTYPDLDWNKLISRAAEIQRLTHNSPKNSLSRLAGWLRNRIA